MLNFIQKIIEILFHTIKYSHMSLDFGMELSIEKETDMYFHAQC